MGESERGARHLADHDLADEIVLYGDLVVAASESERHLSLPEIDEVLGVAETEHEVLGGSETEHEVLGASEAEQPPR